MTMFWPHIEHFDLSFEINAIERAAYSDVSVWKSINTIYIDAFKKCQNDLILQLGSNEKL